MGDKWSLDDTGYGDGYIDGYDNGYIDGYNEALEDFAEKMNKMLGATDLRDNGYYIENLVSIAKNELKKQTF